MGIEPTARFWRATGFEDQGGHQTPITSSASLHLGKHAAVGNPFGEADRV